MSRLINNMPDHMTYNKRILVLRQAIFSQEKDMRTHWTSKKKKSVINERREQLDLILQFGNSDLRANENDHLVRQFHDFLRSVVTGHQESCPDLSSNENDDLIYGLQKHLRARLEKIIHNTKLLWEMPLWKIAGSVEFTMDAREGRFYHRFHLRKIKPENELKALKRIIDLALIEIIRDLDSKPNRFRKCTRCGNYFYQPTERKKVYCSIKCGDAVRLQKNRKKGGENKNKAVKAVT